MNHRVLPDEVKKMVLSGFLFDLPIAPRISGYPGGVAHHNVRDIQVLLLV
jgi:hypothetical protein